MRGTPLEITPHEVKQKLDSGEKVHLVDVREPHEHQAARIEGARLVPMRTVPGEMAELRRLAQDALVVVYCHHGIRSLQTVNWLRRQGVERCLSMQGGIDLWSAAVDASVPRY